MHTTAPLRRAALALCGALTLFAALSAGPAGMTGARAEEAPTPLEPAAAQTQAAQEAPETATPAATPSEKGIILPPLPTNTPTRTPTPINIGNYVWEDLDDDGVQDGFEAGIPGVTVQLWNAAKTQLIDQDVTNASGAYTLVAPTPGDYRVRVLLPVVGSGYTVKDSPSATDQTDSDINPTGTNFGFTDQFTLASNVISTTIYDAGLINVTPPTPTRTPTPINIGNLVWNDVDGDGVKDAAEPGVPFVRLQLWNAAKTQLIDEAVSSASGSYTLVAPTPGDYRVRVLLPPGATFTVKDSASATDQTDSDINPTGVSAGFTDQFTLASNVISTTIYDAGLRNPPANFTPTATLTPVVAATATSTATSTPTLEPRVQLPAVER